MLSMLALLQGADDGLTLAEVLSDVPHDPASIAVYLILVGSLYLVWRTGRARKPPA